MNATAPPSDAGLPAAAAPEPATLAAKVAACRPTRKWTAAACLALLPMLVATALAFARPASMRPLFLQDLSERDAGAVAEVLATRGVPYTVSPAGRIMVPAELTDRLRLEMARQGYPSRSVLVYGGPNPPRPDLSPLEEPASFKASLEGELALIIMTLGVVDAAKVLLSSPPSEGDRSDPVQVTASVTVRLRPGQALDDRQLAGIVHLVHKSVPGLPARNVSVIDDQGKLLLREPAASAQ